MMSDMKNIKFTTPKEADESITDTPKEDKKVTTPDLIAVFAGSEAIANDYIKNNNTKTKNHIHINSLEILGRSRPNKYVFLSGFSKTKDFGLIIALIIERNSRLIDPSIIIEHPKRKTSQPKGSMCATCKNRDKDCSELNFESMPPLSIDDDVIIVRCTEFKRNQARN